MDTTTLKDGKNPDDGLWGSVQSRRGQIRVTIPETQCGSHINDEPKEASTDSCFCKGHSPCTEESARRSAGGTPLEPCFSPRTLFCQLSGFPLTPGMFWFLKYWSHLPEGQTLQRCKMPACLELLRKIAGPGELASGVHGGCGCSKGWRSMSRGQDCFLHASAIVWMNALAHTKPAANHRVSVPVVPTAPRSHSSGDTPRPGPHRGPRTGEMPGGRERGVEGRSEDRAEGEGLRAEGQDSHASCSPGGQWGGQTTADKSTSF